MPKYSNHCHILSTQQTFIIPSHSRTHICITFIWLYALELQRVYKPTKKSMKIYYSDHVPQSLV